MAKGYLVAHIRVHDKEGFEKFKAMSGPVMSEYRGKVLVRNPKPEIRKGDQSGIAIVIEIGSIDTARSCYESDGYNEARAVRELASKSELISINGI